jgi:hypothetical protein
MKTHRRHTEKFHAFLTSEIRIDGGEWSSSCFGRFASEERSFDIDSIDECASESGYDVKEEHFRHFREPGRLTTSNWQSC